MPCWFYGGMLSWPLVERRQAFSIPASSLLRSRSSTGNCLSTGSRQEELDKWHARIYSLLATGGTRLRNDQDGIPPGTSTAFHQGPAGHSTRDQQGIPPETKVEETSTGTSAAFHQEPARHSTRDHGNQRGIPPRTSTANGIPPGTPGHSTGASTRFGHEQPDTVISVSNVGWRFLEICAGRRRDLWPAHAQVWLCNVGRPLPTLITCGGQLFVADLEGYLLIRIQVPLRPWCNSPLLAPLRHCGEHHRWLRRRGQEGRGPWGPLEVLDAKS